MHYFRWSISAYADARVSDRHHMVGEVLSWASCYLLKQGSTGWLQYGTHYMGLVHLFGVVQRLYALLQSDLYKYTALGGW